MDINSWILFSSIAFVATISPGPAILLVTTHSFSYGLKRSIATMLGNITGLLVMSGLSVAGLSAIILHSAAVFTFVKLVGAAYLVYLGVNLIRKGFGGGVAAGDGIRASADLPPYTKLYLNGLLVALSNPKAIAFTTALFPQFIVTSSPILPQFTVLVATFMFLSFACLFGYGYVSSRARNRVRQTRQPSALSKVFGVVFIVSGGVLAGTPQR